MSNERHVEREMAEQPRVLADLLARREAFADALVSLARRQLAGVLLVARGSSDNAATYGRYVLEAATGRPAALSANSLFTRYDCRTDLRGWLVVAISQSGETPEIAEVVARARARGGTTLAVTNDEGSSLAAASDIVLGLGVGAERAVPATKTYTATLLALALLAEALGTPPWPSDALEAVPDHVASVLADTASVVGVVPMVREAVHSVHLGTGFLFCAALESALKMRETTLLPVEGYANADFLHGPIAASGAGSFALCHVGAAETKADAALSAAAIRASGARVIAVGSDIADIACDHVLGVPAMPEGVAAIAHAVRGQQLAVAAATALGRDPDRPAGLTKVTPTN